MSPKSPKSTLFKLNAGVLIALILALNGMGGMGIHAAAVMQATATMAVAATNSQGSTNIVATMSPLPASQPLILLWQANVAPDDLVIDANSLAVDDLGNCYVSSGSGYPLKEFDSNGKMVATFGSQGTGDGQFTWETGVAIDAQGNLFVADFVDAPRIEKFDSKGNFLTSWATEAPTGPTGIGVDSKGNVYVANHRTHDHYIQKFDNNGKLLTEWGTTGTGDGQFTAGGHSGIEGLTVDKQDNVYATDPINHRIQKFDSSGKFLAQFGTNGINGNGQFDNPTTVAVDVQGNIYVNDGIFLQKLDPTGKFLAQWSTDGLSGDLDRAGSIAVTGQGDIYVMANGTVTSAAGTFDIPVLKKFKQP